MAEDLPVSPQRAAQLRAASRTWPSLDLTPRQLCDLELILTGGFAPLTGFMTRAQYASVTERSRLDDGAIWPVPVTLEVDAAVQRDFRAGERVALRDREGVMLAALTVSDTWTDAAGRRHLGGGVEAVQLPQHYDFTRLRQTPSDARAAFAQAGWSNVAAFHALVPAPATVVAPALAQAKALGLPLFVQLVTGAVRADDLDHYERVRAYEQACAGDALFGIVPLWLEATAARALLLRAIVASNFGCTHLLVAGEIPAEARKLAWEIGIELVAMPEAAAPAVPAPAKRPDRAAQGFTVFFTGLSGSGKSTIANALLVKLLELGDRTVTILDGDVVRKHLSSELGFSKEHRDLNIRRIGYVASEITKHGGIAICAPIAPYDEVRKDVRRMIEPYGGFILVHVSTPLEVCEQRDRKGLYAKARAGLVQQFTGISDPYEVPADAALTVNAAVTQPTEAAAAVIDYLRSEHYLT